MKKYLVEFVYLDGSKEEVEFKTDNISFSVEQYRRNRMIKSFNILEEGISKGKQMLFG